MDLRFRQNPIFNDKILKNRAPVDIATHEPRHPKYITKAKFQIDAYSDNTF